MSEKIRIAYLTKDMPVNGITTVIMNYCRNLDKNKFKISILSGAPIMPMYQEECARIGVEIIEVPRKKTEALKYYVALWKNLSKDKYDIVHVHGNSATISIELMIAFLKGIKVRIAHSHNSTCDSLKIHKILSPVLKKIYTHGFACSELAGNWLFGNKKFSVLPNGFDTGKFVFDQEKRNKIRKEIGFKDEFVIGTVARFNDQKNHPYLLNIFKEVASIREDAYLLLVGDGPDLKKVQALIEEHPYKDRIIYYGVTDHVEDIYNAIDVFVLPSKYEGLGIVFLEAQINGLLCITSDVVPREVALGERMIFLPLADDLKKWKKTILETAKVDRETFYKKYKNQIMQYDIRRNAEELEKQYLMFLKG